MKKFLGFWVIVGVIHLVIFGCTDSEKIEKRPNFKLSQEFGIDSKELFYRYYQQFVFSDLCEDLRFIARQPIVPDFEQALPISPEDLV